jgi:hypothetical protein
MGDIILFCVIITAGLGFIAHATIGRIFGFHRPMRWTGGGQISFTGELSIGFFLLCSILTFSHSAVWVIPAVAAFAVGFISQWRAPISRQKRGKSGKKKEPRMDTNGH